MTSAYHLRPYHLYALDETAKMSFLRVSDAMLVDSDGRAKRNKYTCPSCHNILRSPVQPSCGHWLCKQCAENLFQGAEKSKNAPVCLKEDCGEILSKEDGSYYFPDHFVRKDIDRIKVNCVYCTKGCNWTGKYGDLKSHLRGCEYHKFICSLCDQQLAEGQEEAHQKICPNALCDCPLAHIGCTTKDKMTRSEVREHVTDNLVEHIEFIARAIDVLNKKEGSSSPMLPPLHDNGFVDQGYHSLIPTLGGDVEVDGLSSHPKLTNKVKGQRYETDGGEPTEIADGSSFVGMRKKGGRCEVDGSGFGMRKTGGRCMADDSSDEIDGGGTPAEIKRLLKGGLSMQQDDYTGQQRFIDVLHKQATEKVLVKELGKLRQEMEKKFTKETRAQTEEISSLRATCAKLERNLRAKNTEAEDTNFRLSLLENCNHDGSMIWKIPQISQRMSDAQNGKYTSIFSLPFYTGRYGFKMCMRLYILGDGIGKGSHMSLFFVLMKGEFDNILQWPFTHKVTFKLINQAGGRDVVDTFQPDPMSSSFRKPKSDMNIASGCPRFVSLHELKNNGFIVDDTIFVKCVVDCTTIRHP